MSSEPPLVRRVLTPLAEFLRSEAIGGTLLLAAALVALVWANVAGGSYEDVWGRHITLGIGGLSKTLDTLHWVNEGLMAIFFLVVGLEIKRELVLGELRDRRTAALPAIAAVGGMVVPAALYLAVNAGSGTSRGWGVPMATDIAFALGVLALLSRWASPSLKLLLLTLAIVDDLGAILVIALFYGEGVAFWWLAGAGGVVAVLILMRIAGLTSIAWYALPSVALWICVLGSGVHATIAGVALGLLTPTKASPRYRDRPSPLETLEHALHPWSAFLVIPVFALANAGVGLGAGVLRDAFTSPITWGIVVGLVAGKVLGIAGAAWLAVRTRVAQLPPDVTARDILALGALGGIGFTVSLFVADLAFRDGNLDDAKIGVLAASVLAALLATATLVVRRRAGAPTR